MHGLHTIHGQNETAAREAYDRKVRELLAQGLTVLYKTDTLGLRDITVPAIGFETVALARQALIGKGAFYSVL